MKKVISLLCGIVFLLTNTFAYTFKIDDGMVELNLKSKEGDEIFVELKDGQSYEVKEGNVTLSEILNGNGLWKFVMPTSNVHIHLGETSGESAQIVTLDRQGATNGTASITAIHGNAMPAITVPSKTGYTFGGYYTGINGSGTQYYTSTGTSAKNWDKTSGTTLYAKWTANTYTVIYNSNEGSGTMANSSHTYGVAKTLTANTFTKSGYTFAGWNTQADGSGISYADEESVTNLTSTAGGTVTL